MESSVTFSRDTGRTEALHFINWHWQKLGKLLPLLMCVIDLRTAHFGVEGSCPVAMEGRGDHLKL